MQASIQLRDVIHSLVLEYTFYTKYSHFYSYTLHKILIPVHHIKYEYLRVFWETFACILSVLGCVSYIMIFTGCFIVCIDYVLIV